MKFGAHEVMEAHEILTEKMNMINHFALYEQEAQNEQLRSMIRRHLDAAIQGYEQMLAYTHDYSAAQQTPRPMPQPNASIDQLKYGLRNPPPVRPVTAGRFNDDAIWNAVLISHKASALCHIQRGLEVSDPNLREMFMYGAINCYNMAYETFLLMNEQGYYQVPSMDNHTAKTFLHSFQPVAGGMNNPAMFGQTGMQMNPQLGNMPWQGQQ